MLLLAVDDNDGEGDDVTTIDTPGDGDWFTETGKTGFRTGFYKRIEYNLDRSKFVLKASKKYWLDIAFLDWTNYIMGYLHLYYQDHFTGY